MPYEDDESSDPFLNEDEEGEEEQADASGKDPLEQDAEEDEEESEE